MHREEKIKNFLIEIILVDSGSNDKTLSIANKHKIIITHIEKKSFTFGRSLNIGCDIATGDILVFISGHPGMWVTHPVDGRQRHRVGL